MLLPPSATLALLLLALAISLIKAFSFSSKTTLSFGTLRNLSPANGVALDFRSVFKFALSNSAFANKSCALLASSWASPATSASEFPASIDPPSLELSRRLPLCEFVLRYFICVRIVHLSACRSRKDIEKLRAVSRGTS